MSVSLPIVKIEPGMILMDKLSDLPYYREQKPRLFQQITRIMPKMIDVMAMLTEAEPTDNEFIFRFVAKDAPTHMAVVPGQATPPQQSKFSFPGAAPPPAAAPVAAAAIGAQRMTKDDFAQQYSTWTVYDPENPPQAWVHKEVQRVSWIGNDCQGSSISYTGPKIVSGVRDACGYEAFMRWCMEDLQYLPQEVMVRYRQPPPAASGQRMHIPQHSYMHGGSGDTHYLLFRSEPDLVMARLKFGCVVTN
jgi:hypothetical protein